MSENDPELSRAYRGASRETPPAALDAAILAAARKQVAQPQGRKHSQGAGRSLWWSWMAPAGTIVTLVLGVSIALLIEREQTVTTDETLIHAAPPRAASPPPARATEAPESTKAKSADSAATAGAVKKETAAGALPEKVPVFAAPIQVPEPASPPAQAFPAERRAKASGSRMAAPKATMGPSVASDAEVRGLGAGAPAAANKLAPLRLPATQRSPEAWLEEISRLEREGREQEAAEQLAEFRKAYPAYALPENFRNR